MRKLFILTLTLLLSFEFSSSNFNGELSKNHSQRGKLSILTWNVQMVPRMGSLFSSSLRKLQNERTEWIIEYLKTKNYDVVLLQECFDYSFIDKVNQRLFQQYPYQINPHQPYFFKLSNGLMVLSKYPLEIKDKIVFKNSAQSDIFTSKGALLTMMHIENDSFYILNTHLQADYDEEKYKTIRTEQLNDINKRLIKKHFSDSSATKKLILAGDLNIEENIDSEEYNNLVRKYNFIDLVFQFFKKPSISFDNNNYWNKEYKTSCRLDYFLTNFKVKNLNIDIQTPKKLRNNEWIDLADHYGISADFSLN